MDFLPQLTLNPPSGQLIPTESNHAGPSPGWWKPISLPHLLALHPVRLEQVAGPVLGAGLWASPQGLATWLWGGLLSLLTSLQALTDLPDGELQS